MRPVKLGKPKVRKPPVYRPVQRFKRKMRGIGVKPRIEDLGVVTIERDGQLVQEHQMVGIDRKHWVRFYPNFGFTLLGWHWCRRGKH